MKPFIRIAAHLEDNLLTTASGLHHNGALQIVDEVMSLTTEKLVVYLWLSLIDNHLPAYVAQVYAHDLQTCTLTDIQLRLSQSMEFLLAELSAQEELQVHYTKSRFQHHGRTKTNAKSKSSRRKQCAVCKSYGRPHNGHDVGDIWFLLKFEKMEIALVNLLLVRSKNVILTLMNNLIRQKVCHQLNMMPPHFSLRFISITLVM